MPGNFHRIPASVVESWPEPEYQHPRGQQAWLPEFACVFLGVSTILVAGRFYLRAHKQAGAFGLDDLLIGIAWLFSVALSTVACIDSLWYGLGRHTWDVRIEWYSGAALMGWLAQIFFLTSTCSTKCSVLLFYRRMVKDTGSWKYAIWTALAATAGYYLGILLAYCFICRPLAAYWLSYNFDYTGSYQCVDGDLLSMFVGILSVISDIYAVALPFVILQHYNLEVPRRQRLGLNIIFSLSLIVAGAGIARTYYLWKINHTYDTSYIGFYLFVWSLVECHLAIIFACAPSLRAFIRRYLGEPLNRKFGGSSSFLSNKTSRWSDSKRNSSPSRRNKDDNSGSGRKVLAGFMTTTTTPLDLKGIDERRMMVERDSSAKSAKVVRRGIEEDDDEEKQELAEKSIRPESSEIVVEPRTPTIRSPEEYELYNMQQLSKHAYNRRGPGAATATDSLGSDFADPKRRHDVENARSWLDDDHI